MNAHHFLCVGVLLLATSTGTVRCTKNDSRHRLAVLQDSAGVRTMKLQQHIDDAARTLNGSDGSETIPEMPEFQAILDSACYRLRKINATAGIDTACIESLNTILYQEWAIAMDTGSTSVQNIFPRAVLKNKKGSCLGVTLLIVLMAQRIHLPLHAVLLPGHIYVTYEKNGITRNIEPNKYGVHHPDEYYAERYRCARNVWYHRPPLTATELAGVFYYAVATVLLKKKDIHPAHSFLHAGVRCFPQYYSAWGNLGLLYSMQGKRDSAGIAFHTAAALHPGDPQVWYNIGTWESAGKKFVPAIQAYLEGLAKDTANPLLLYGIAHAYYKEGRRDSAVLFMKKLEAANDTTPRGKRLKRLIEGM